MGCTNSKHTKDDLPAGSPGQPPTSSAPKGVAPTSIEMESRAQGVPPSIPTAQLNPDTRPTPEGPQASAHGAPKPQPGVVKANSTDHSKVSPRGPTTNARRGLPEAGDLEPTTTALLQELPQFRILVIGKTGVGKTTLINTTFDVPDISGRSGHLVRGISNIDEELTSKSNERFVLHDSMGFEPGETGHFEKVRAFIEERRKKELLKEKLHAIWLCVSTPASGGRIFETGDEDFFRLDLSSGGFTVPVIIVFTKYDVLASEVERSMEAEDDEEVLSQETEKRFNEACQRRLGEIKEIARSQPPHVKVSIRYRHTLEELVQVTQKEIIDKNPDIGKHRIESPEAANSSEDTSEAVRTVQAVKLAWAMAQRVSPALKIKASIEIGKRKYWRGIEEIPWNAWSKHLDAIHADIIKVWNFNDPDERLTNSGSFKGKIFQEIEKLGDPNTNTVVTQRVVGYIVDLTIIMHNLSTTLQNLSKPLPNLAPGARETAKTGHVTQGLLDDAHTKYYSTPGGTGEMVHRDIRIYVGSASATTIPAAESALDVVIKLIKSYCFHGGNQGQGS